MIARLTAPLIVAFLALAGSARAQDAASQSTSTTVPSTIAVYLDCHFCDFDFLRVEIPYVNWVNDRTAADVHLLATSQTTGGGGQEYTFNFIGLRGFAARVDTLKYQASVTSTTDERRRGYLRTVKTGFVPFLSRTAVADRLNITVAALPGGAASPLSSMPLRDPWHAWVFTLSGSAYTSGEKQYKFFNGYFYGQASRTTAVWKSILGGDFSYDDSKSIVELGNFAGDADTTYVTIRRNWSAYGTQYRALTGHWSAGLTGSVGSNSYNNQDRYARVKAGVEYNFFPYRESTRRQLRAQYGAGLAHYNYTDTTIYLETAETVPIHHAALAASARQPWGSLNSNISHNALILDPGKRSTRINANGTVRIVKGLEFSVSGSYTWIHDQLYLRKGALTTANVLLRQQALRTSYSYYGNVGLRYTFGSVLNNVVFPRFGGSDIF